MFGNRDTDEQLAGTEIEESSTTDADITGPAVPELPDEGSVVIFDDDFGGVIDLEQGVQIPDPLEQLDPSEQADYHAGLKDIVRAQRYAENLGMIPPRKL